VSKEYYKPDDDYFSGNSTEAVEISDKFDQTSYDEKAIEFPTDLYGRVTASKRIIGRVDKQN